MPHTDRTPDFHQVAGRGGWDRRGNEYQIKRAAGLGVGIARPAIRGRGSQRVGNSCPAGFLDEVHGSGRAFRSGDSRVRPGRAGGRIFAWPMALGAVGVGLAVLADSVLCSQDLWFLLNYGSFALQHLRWLEYDVLDFAALTVLLYEPVRRQFLGRPKAQGRAAMPLGRTQTARVDRALKPLHILTYFAAAVISTCVATAFCLALWMGQKNGGSRGFVLFLYFGFVIGSVAAFLFALVLTLVVRKFGSARLWLWLLTGAALAPALTGALGLIGIMFFATGVVGVALRGPAYLLQVWWLTIPPGAFTGLICYATYPWAFEID